MSLIKSSKKQKIIIVAGPTASGKTNYAIKLAKELNGELINVDSRQIYKGLDIGTNKGLISKIENNETEISNNRIANAFELENSKIIGWLFDIINPNEIYSVLDFKNDCEIIIENILKRGKQPILVGGTGLYIDAIVKNYQLPKDKALIKSEVLPKDLKSLQTKVIKELYPSWKALNNSDRNNPIRLQRLLERSGTVFGTLESPYEFEIIYPIFEKEKLIEKIRDRVELMFMQGLLEETKKAIENGYADTKILNGLGYQEVQDCINNLIRLEECKELVKIRHAQYAKKQITWFEGKGRGYEMKRVEF